VELLSLLLAHGAHEKPDPEEEDVPLLHAVRVVAEPFVKHCLLTNRMV
jgi:hypothetical protein